MKEMHVDPITEPFTSDQERIREIIREIYIAAAQKDWKRLEAFHLDSPKFSKWDDMGHTGVLDYAATMKAERDIFGALTKFDYDVHDLRVSVFGSTAVLTYQFSYDVVFNNEPLKATEKATLVFVNAGGEWKIVHEHFSPL